VVDVAGGEELGAEDELCAALCGVGDEGLGAAQVAFDVEIAALDLDGGDAEGSGGVNCDSRAPLG
jgi:hypothetical protein